MGNLQDYEVDRLGFLVHLRDEYGPMASFDGRTTVVSDPVLADVVLRDPLKYFEIGQNFLGQRLSMTEVAAVLDVRPLLNPGLRHSAVTPLQHQVWAQTIETFGPGVDAAPIDPSGPTEAVISHVVASHYFGGEGRFLIPGIAALLDALEAVIGNVFALPASWRSPTQRRIESCYFPLHHAVCDLLEQRQKRAGNDLASLVLAKASGRHGLSRLADLLIGSMLAAQRVPAAAAGWILMLVADNPGVQHRLRTEAGMFSEHQRNNLSHPSTEYPVALATVLESLRLYPPTWLLARSATQPVQLGGHEFPAGHTFLVSPYVIHRDDELFPRAATFDPDRWLGPTRPSTGYLPFGRGRHRCPGADLATNCLVALLLTLVRRQDIRRVGPVRPDPRATLRPAGLRISLRAVNEAA